ncbi:hypothetical protein HYS93_04585 [Candidatus Daviesbacteria bacterium]|nr:hypothetical protein [Candidatus Daviesbacteria bacterium]
MTAELKTLELSSKPVQRIVLSIKAPTIEEVIDTLGNRRFFGLMQNFNSRGKEWRAVTSRHLGFRSYQGGSQLEAVQRLYLAVPNLEVRYNCAQYHDVLVPSSEWVELFTRVSL